MTGNSPVQLCPARMLRAISSAWVLSVGATPIVVDVWPMTSSAVQP